MEQRQDEYLERLLMSLAVRDVPSERIAEILAEVSSHLDASGEDPAEAFGPTSELADALVEARPEARERRVHPFSMATIVVGSFAAPLLLLSAGTAMITGEPVTVTAGTLAGIAVGLAAIGAALPLGRAWLDGRRGRWPGVAVLTAGLIAFVVLAGVLTTPVIAELPAWSVLLAGAACLAVVVALVTLVRAEPFHAHVRGADPSPTAEGGSPHGPRPARNGYCAERRRDRPWGRWSHLGSGSSS